MNEWLVDNIASINRRNFNQIDLMFKSNLFSKNAPGTLNIRTIMYWHWVQETRVKIKTNQQKEMK